MPPVRYAYDPYADEYAAQLDPNYVAPAPQQAVPMTDASSSNQGTYTAPPPTDSTYQYGDPGDYSAPTQAPVAGPSAYQPQAGGVIYDNSGPADTSYQTPANGYAINQGTPPAPGAGYSPPVNSDSLHADPAQAYQYAPASNQFHQAQEPKPQGELKPQDTYLGGINPVVPRSNAWNPIVPEQRNNAGMDNIQTQPTLQERHNTRGTDAFGQTGTDGTSDPHYVPPAPPDSLGEFSAFEQHPEGVPDAIQAAQDRQTMDTMDPSMLYGGADPNMTGQTLSGGSTLHPSADYALRGLTPDTWDQATGSPELDAALQASPLGRFFPHDLPPGALGLGDLSMMPIDSPGGLLAGGERELAGPGFQPPRTEIPGRPGEVSPPSPHVGEAPTVRPQLQQVIDSARAGKTGFALDQELARQQLATANPPTGGRSATAGMSEQFANLATEVPRAPIGGVQTTMAPPRSRPVTRIVEPSITGGTAPKAPTSAPASLDMPAPPPLSPRAQGALDSAASRNSLTAAERQTARTTQINQQAQDAAGESLRLRNGTTTVPAGRSAPPSPNVGEAPAITEPTITGKVPRGFNAKQALKVGAAGVGVGAGVEQVAQGQQGSGTLIDKILNGPQSQPRPADAAAAPIATPASPTRPATVLDPSDFHSAEQKIVRTMSPLVEKGDVDTSTGHYVFTDQFRKDNPDFVDAEGNWTAAAASYLRDPGFVGKPINPLDLRDPGNKPAAREATDADLAGSGVVAPVADSGGSNSYVPYSKNSNSGYTHRSYGGGGGGGGYSSGGGGGRSYGHPQPNIDQARSVLGPDFMKGFMDDFAFGDMFGGDFPFGDRGRPSTHPSSSTSGRKTKRKRPMKSKRTSTKKPTSVGFPGSKKP